MTNTSIKKSCHETDKFVGQAIRNARAARGMTQLRLGELLGITFQQVQKYERAANRVSSGKLFLIAQILKFDIEWFYPDRDDKDTERGIDNKTRLLLKHTNSLETHEMEALVLIAKKLSGIKD